MKYILTLLLLSIMIFSPSTVLSEGIGDKTLKINPEKGYPKDYLNSSAN